MTEKVRTIRLYGYLGTRFGRMHRLAVNSPAEGIRALCTIIPGFKAELIASKDRGIRYAVFRGKENLAPEEMQLPPGKEDIRIAPVMQGAKRGGIFQTILGVALVVIGIYTNNPQLAYSGGAMALGGVVQMLAPHPVGLSSKDNPDNGASYNFNGPVNTSAQGNPAPLLYGMMIVGSSVISGGIYAEDQA